MSIIKPLHDPILKRRKIKIAEALQFSIPKETKSLADIGCGDGEITMLLNTTRPEISTEGWDVHPREHCHIPFQLFDGKTLPHQNDHIDITTLVDVLHHDNHPEILLKEVARITKKGILIKDHICANSFDFAKLSFMDWVGNHHYGVHLPYNYLSLKKWDALFEACNLEIKTWTNNLALYPQPLEKIFGGKLHFVALLTKKQ